MLLGELKLISVISNIWSIHMDNLCASLKDANTTGPELEQCSQKYNFRTGPCGMKRTS
jgi:hypothetical protein